MLNIENKTIGEAFAEAATSFVDNDLLVVPQDAERTYHRNGWSCSFGSAYIQVQRMASALTERGYAHGHRIAVLLENRPEMLLLKLAFNSLGISWVPINPDYRVAEISYLLSDSDAALVIVSTSHSERVRAAVSESGSAAPCLVWAEDLKDSLRSMPPAVSPAPLPGLPGLQSEASLLYTSGTTGRPKGCILGHEYELMLGAWYASRGGAFTLRECGERVYNPLPLFHINAGIVGFYGMLLTGNCMVIPERFSRTRWWPEVRATKATGCHYLGVIIPVLMNDDPGPQDREHDLRWAFGAGVEPTLHRAFEERFGFPLIEGWGMTEMCRILADCDEPRQIDTRAMGRAKPDLEIRVVDDVEQDVRIGETGEMIVRHSEATPRKGAFSGYLNQPQATEEGWRGGWWHTGDTVRQDDTGMVYFVDRKKNIIRRSGENIAAAEVEAVLQACVQVAQVAVISVQDEMRDEEVMACIVLNKGVRSEAIASDLFNECYQQLTYYKAPGWIVFVESLPVTGTQKVLKHMIFGADVDPRQLAQAHDLRALKVR